VPTTVGGRTEEVTGEGSMRRLSVPLELPVRWTRWGGSLRMHWRGWRWTKLAYPR
jgi:hypothetical protein